MTKSLTKVGNSVGIVFDRAFLDSANLKLGDEFNVTSHEGGSIVLTPIRPTPGPKEISKTIKATMTDYSRTMKKLA